MIPLFEHYPLLGEKLPYIALGEFPTPIQKLERFGQEIGVDQLYIKRDDLSGKQYGGNKVRKLEFLLGRAIREQKKEVFTFGFAGSNHATATAIYANQVGLRSISMLLPQPNAQYVRHNLLLSYHCGAELHQYCNKTSVVIGTLRQLLRHKVKYGKFPQMIPPGGSSALGTIGFINAAFELKVQIVSGAMPEPDRIYVALGSTGTAVGLTIGLKAAHLKTQVIPIRVVDKSVVNNSTFQKHFTQTLAYLHALDPSFPTFDQIPEHPKIVNGFLGKGYAHFTREGMEAVTCMEQSEGIPLDGTYTGKTVAALIDDAQKQALRDHVVLFWNTLNSKDFSDIIKQVDYKHLPECFHWYFEKEVQTLDRRF